MNQAVWILAIATVLSSACAQAGSDLADSIEKFNEIEGADERASDFELLLNARFEKIQIVAGESPIRDIPDDDLGAYFAAANKITFYSMKPSYTERMRRIFEELHRRQLATQTSRQQMLDSYTRARMLDDARGFAADPDNAGLTLLPTMRDESSPGHSPTLWRVRDAGRTLVRHDVDLPDGPVLVVLGPPSCGFSRKAAEEIAKEGDLFELMARHSIWLMPQSGIPDVSVLNAWSTSQPGWRKEVIHLNSDWPFIDASMSPGFYFLNNGKVVSHVQGWPGPEQLAELRDGFEKIGIRSALRNNQSMAEPAVQLSTHP